MNGYEIIFLAISCFVAGYCWRYVQTMEGEENNEQNGERDDEQRYDRRRG